MNVRVFTLSFSSVLGGFDDGAVREFVKDKEVLAVRDHFFLKDESPHLVLVVTYNMPRPEQEISTRKSQVKEGGRDREAWRKTLEEADWPLFNTLRDWRNGQAKEEGIPPYVICTNQQLAEIAHRRPLSLNKLAAIERLGKAKLERYGKAMLGIVAEYPQEETSGEA